MMSMNFPEHWASFNMLDIIDYEGGSQPPKKDFIYEPKKGYVRLVQIRDYGNNPFPTYVPFTPKLKLTEEDDIMIARYGGSAGSDSLGRICEGIKGAYNVALTKVIYPKSILPRSFVKYLLDGPWLKERLNSLSRSCQSGFNRDDLDGLHLPLPPMNEQKRIVEKLDAILLRVKSAKARLEKIPAILKKFRQSVLAAACSGRLTEDWREGKDLLQGETEETKADYSVDIDCFPVVWDKLKLETVSDYLNGFQFKSSKYISTSKNQVIRIGNVKKGFVAIDESPVYIDDAYAKENSRFEILENDILISLTGTKYKQDYGYACLVQRPQHRYFLNQRVAVLRTKDKIKPEYLNLYLQTNLYRDVFFSNETGNANQGNVGIDALVYPIIGVPSVEEQQEIIRRVEKLFALADSIETKYKKAFARVEKIEQSVLAKAFRGELVDPDPNDEPAEELLKRILEEKAKLVGGKKMRKRNGGKND